jgi:TolB-like protein/Tfp pilus assembly protein PilF/DNA-binding winged helix-turn-helix (wHTH) protein
MSTGAGVVEVRLLGRFEVVRNGMQIPENAWGQRKVKSLFALLLSQPGRVFSHDVLIDGLFEEADPERARSSLYALVSRLRRTLEPGLKRGNDSVFVVREGEGYCFNIESPCWIDTIEFLKHVDLGEERGRRGDHLQEVAAYEEAIRLYRGDFLESNRYEEWTLKPREQWQDQYITALRRLANGYAHLGDYNRAATACREAFSLQPWRESMLRQLMAYHHMAGERSEALHVYQEGVEALKRDLGVEPTSETKELRRKVLEELNPDTGVVRDRTRIAVLPLVNLSPDPSDEYFADGMTEELIYRLSQVRELKVIAQTSALAYKNTKKTVAQIGRELSIGTVLEGSVRKAKNAIRITIQLIDVSNEEHLWAQEYDRPFRDVFSVQKDIAERVADSLRAELLDSDRERIGREVTDNLEAYTLYLRGRRALLGSTGIEDLRAAADLFERALGADPDYALAWSGLAASRCLLWFYSDVSDKHLSSAREAADRALELAPMLAEAVAAQAVVKWVGDRDLNAAETLFRKAIDLAPRDATIHSWYGLLLNHLGRRGEGLLEALKAQEVDPLSPASRLELGAWYRSVGRDEDAESEFRELLKSNPQDVEARMAIAFSRIRKWDWKGAEAEMCKAIKLNPKAPKPQIEYAVLLVCMGRNTEAKAVLERVVESTTRPLPRVVLNEAARVCIFLGDVGRALDLANRAVAEAPRMWVSYWFMGLCYCLMGQYDRALDATLEGERRTKGFYRAARPYMSLWIHWLRGLTHSRSGNATGTREAVDQVMALPNDLGDRALVLALLLFEVGKIDEGFSWMLEALGRQDPTLHQMRGFPVPENVRDDPRYAAVFEKMGLPLFEA